MPHSGEYRKLGGSQGIGSLLEKLENIQQELTTDGTRSAAHYQIPFAELTVFFFTVQDLRWKSLKMSMNLHT